MALTGPRIVASIYGAQGPAAAGAPIGTMGRTLQLAFGVGVSFYDQINSVGNVTCNSIIEVQPNGLQLHPTKYYSVQTAAQIISGGA